MRNAASRLLTVALCSGTMGLFVLGHPAEVRAQSVFCPQFIPDLRNGACTNTRNGAVSGAALASQALSELSETITQETTKNTIDAVTNRRAQEEQRCAEGFTRVEGTCQPIPKPVPQAAASAVSPAPAPTPAEAHKPRGTKAKAAARRRHHLAPPAPEVVRREPAPPSPSMLMPVPIEPAILPFPIEPGVRYATWGQIYGDYEKRNAAGPADLFESSGAAIGVANVAVESRTGTVGFLAGGDLTSRGVIFGGDGLIAGVMAGFVSSNLTLNATNLQFNTPTQPATFVGIGASRTTAHLSGPTAGLYATYFNGGFSTDFTLRVDALNLDETFNESAACSCGAQLPVSGNGSVPLLNATIAGNLNYRFNLYPNFWIEPTVGAQYTNSSYGSNAATQLGLDDGNLVMVQGGARFGTSTLIDNHILMTTTLTGLAYDDVLVAGGFIPAAAFEGQNLLVQADQGQVRGRGILAFNFDFGQGISTYVLGEARGGKGLFGAGGKAGVRVQW